MMKPCRHWLVVIPFVGLPALVGAADVASRDASDTRRAVDAVTFQRHIRPILSDKCFQCHGPDAASRESDLRMDEEASVILDRGGYSVVNRDAPESSELLRRIESKDDAEVMPPPDVQQPLTPEERLRLREWILQGAPWSQHWAYVRPERPTIPTTEDTIWGRNWIDAFVLQRLEQEGLSPSMAADPVTLLRRLSFDLTGLPPSADQSPPRNAMQTDQLIDQLLASPSFGERMAVYWLDLVRFADTVGYHGDQDHNISPYRDFVIDAWNRNVPFDEFTRDQLAGDLLPDATIDQKVASGYNRFLQTSHEGGVQPKEYLAIYAADRVRNFSAVWLGGTLGCAQCHDHKFDPYTTKDFYAMKAFFADLDEDQHFRVGGNTYPTNRPPEIPVLSRHERTIRAIWSQRLQQATSADEIAALQATIAELDRQTRLTMVSVSIDRRVTRVLPRGNWLDDSGAVVEPAIPEFLGTLPNSSRPATRLDLANWLTDTRDGVGLRTARVMANRIWHLCFGRGLAARLDDFGGQGEAPSHPELLDRLAHELVDSGWDMKHLVRLIVSSATYRQSSLQSPDQAQRDPANRWLSRQSRWRLPAEMVRDTLLSVSSLIVNQLGGPSVHPYQPAGYYRHLNFPTRTYDEHLDARQWRRGVYVHWQRQFLHPMMKAFDAPSREECTAERPSSNTPLAALTLLNDPSSLEAARGFAIRILTQGGSSFDERLAFAFRHAVSRPPSDTESQLLRQLWQTTSEQLTQDSGMADSMLAAGIHPNPNGVDRRQLSAWMMVSRAILNMNETLTRN